MSSAYAEERSEQSFKLEKRWPAAENFRSGFSRVSKQGIRIRNESTTIHDSVEYIRGKRQKTNRFGLHQRKQLARKTLVVKSEKNTNIYNRFGNIRVKKKTTDDRFVIWEDQPAAVIRPARRRHWRPPPTWRWPLRPLCHVCYSPSLSSTEWTSDRRMRWPSPCYDGPRLPWDQAAEPATCRVACHGVRLAFSALTGSCSLSNASDSWNEKMTNQDEMNLGTDRREHVCSYTRSNGCRALANKNFSGLEKSFLCHSQNFSGLTRAPYFWSHFLSSWSQSCGKTQKVRHKKKRKRSLPVSLRAVVSKGKEKIKCAYMSEQT